MSIIPVSFSFSVLWGILPTLLWASKSWGSSCINCIAFTDQKGDLFEFFEKKILGNSFGDLLCQSLNVRFEYYVIFLNNKNFFSQFWEVNRKHKRIITTIQYSKLQYSLLKLQHISKSPNELPRTKELKIQKEINMRW